MNNNVKYYIITLKNVFLSDSKTDVHFGIFDYGKYYDLLTNKEIYMVNDDNISKEEFINSNCKLIGINYEECSSEKIGLFLKFITSSARDILINEVNEMEKSINDSLNSLEQNKIKKLTKSEFLKKY